VIDTIVLSRTDEHLIRLYFSLARSNRHDWLERHRLVIGDNGISERIRKCFPREVRFVPIEEPFVFAKAINDCVEHGCDPYHDILIMNDDTVVETPSFIPEMEIAASRTEYGILSPVITGGGAGNPDQMRPVEGYDIRETKTIICFIAALIRREVWNRVGIMDEQFTGYGFEDTDYNRRVVEAGWKLGVTGAARVWHEASGTYRTKYGSQKHTAMFYESKAKFEAKWGQGHQLGAYANA
jgi:GT2 family glycosyltransferase